MSKWEEIEDCNVINVWVCEECGLTAEINPDWYEDNGTPMCCDDDMVYSHTVINKE